MQFLFDLVDVPVPAVGVVPGIDLALTLDFAPDCVDDLLLFIGGVEFCDLSGGEQVVDVDKEAFVGDLPLGEHEQIVVLFDSCLLVKGLQIGLQIVDPIRGTDGDHEDSHVVHGGGQSTQRLLA